MISYSRGTSLDWLMNKQMTGVPGNALNHRVSAHFTEINNIYGIEMAKKVLSLITQYSKVADELATEYNLASLEDRRTRFARPGYQYVPLSSAPDGK